MCCPLIHLQKSLLEGLGENGNSSEQWIALVITYYPI